MKYIIILWVLSFFIGCLISFIRWKIEKKKFEDEIAKLVEMGILIRVDENESSKDKES